MKWTVLDLSIQIKLEHKLKEIFLKLTPTHFQKKNTTHEINAAA